MFIAGNHDVHGLAAGVTTAEGTWPHILVELNFRALEVAPRTGYELIPELLVGRGLTRVRSLLPVQPQRITWSVLLPKPGRAKDGVYAPARNGAPRVWRVITPLPHTNAAWRQVAQTRHWQCAIYLTTRTTGLSYTDVDEYLDKLQKVAEDGDLFATTAAVFD